VGGQWDERQTDTGHQAFLNRSVNKISKPPSLCSGGIRRPEHACIIGRFSVQSWFYIEIYIHITEWNGYILRHKYQTFDPWITPKNSSTNRIDKMPIRLIPFKGLYIYVLNHRIFVENNDNNQFINRALWLHNSCLSWQGLDRPRHT